MRWPERILDGLCSSLNGRTLDEDGGVVSPKENMQDLEKELRLKFLFMWGMDFSTDYSGWDCPRWAIHELCQALIRRWHWVEELVTTGVRFVRSRDNGHIQNQVLTRVAQDLDDSKSCCNGDMMCRLPPTARKHIRAALPDDDADVAVKVAAHHESHVRHGQSMLDLP